MFHAVCLDDFLLQNRNEERIMKVDFASKSRCCRVFISTELWNVSWGVVGVCLEMWQFDYFMSLVLEGLYYQQACRHDSYRIVTKRGWEGQGVLGVCCNVFKGSTKDAELCHRHVMMLSIPQN